MTGTIDVGATAAQSTSHPDWSPDGTAHRVRARRARPYEEGVNNQRFYTGRIDMVDESGRARSARRRRSCRRWRGHNRYYPSFSPDSKLLAFNESTCPSGRATHRLQRRLRPDRDGVRHQAGRRAARRSRSRARTRGGKTDTGATALHNSWPKWAPFEFQRTQTPGTPPHVDDVLVEPPLRAAHAAPRHEPRSRRPARCSGWSRSIRTARCAGQDPSYRGVRLPFQDVTSSNHIAQWTEEVVTIQ